MMPLDPTVGGTTLRRPAIQSPNYDPVAKTGWAVFQDGTAVFHAITVPAGSGGSTTFVQGTAPTANNVNDIWVNTANSNSLYSWNGTSWVQYQFGTGSIQAGAITAALIAANTITAAQIAAGTITAAQIAAGTITAAQIAAGTITADKIAIGNTLNPNPFFLGQNTGYWSAFGGTLAGVATTGIAFPSAGKFTANAGQSFPGISGTSFPVAPGDPVSVEGWINTAQNLQFTIEFDDINGNFVSQQVTNVTTLNTWKWYEAVLASAPASTASAKIVIKVNSGSTTGTENFQATGLISHTKVDGGTLVANSVTATQIAAATITAAQVAAGTLTAAVINVNDLISNGINTKTLTSVNIILPDAYISNGDGSLTTTPGIFRYSGTPAAGNLIFSSCKAAGHDKFNNNYIAGTTEYDNGTFNAVNVFNGSFGFYDAPSANPNATWTARGSINQLAIPGAGLQLQFAANPNGLGITNGLGIGLLNVSNTSGALESFPGDTNTYVCGQNYENTRVNAVVNSLSFTALKSIPVESGVLYHIRAVLVYTGNQAAGAPIFSFSHGGVGPSITDAVGYTKVDNTNLGVWLNAGVSDRTGPTLDTGGHVMDWDMTFTAPSTGNLIFSVACTVAADTWNAKALDFTMRMLS